MAKHMHSWRTKDHLIKAGWDNPLQTYFAQVYPYPIKTDDDSGEPIMAAWLGCWSHEYSTVNELAVALRPYSEIPLEIEAALERDGSLRRAPSPLQQRMARLAESIAER